MVKYLTLIRSCFTLVAGVNSLSDKKAAGLRLGRVGVPQGQLIWSETEGVILHFSIAVPTSADPTKHRLFLGTFHL